MLAKSNTPPAPTSKVLTPLAPKALVPEIVTRTFGETVTFPTEGDEALMGVEFAVKNKLLPFVQLVVKGPLPDEPQFEVFQLAEEPLVFQ